MLVSGVDTAYIDLFELYRDIVCFEDCLDRLSDLCAYPVAGNEGHGVFSAEFGGLEDVGLYGCVAARLLAQGGRCTALEAG